MNLKGSIINKPALKFPFYIRITLFLFAILNLIIAFLLSGEEVSAWVIGYILGLFAVIIHFVTAHISDRQENHKFIHAYYISLFVRFLIVCILYVAIIMVIKIDEFSFTVSFIISYLFHSVVEVIFLNQKLSN